MMMTDGAPNAPPRTRKAKAGKTAKKPAPGKSAARKPASGKAKFIKPEAPHIAAPTTASKPASPFNQMSREDPEAMEKLSMNLARAAMTAQGAIAEAALRQAHT